MTVTLSSRRPGAACPLILGVLAFLLGAGALFVALCRDPLQPGFVFRNPMSEPLEGYDFNSAAGTAKSETQVLLNGDIRAFAEINRRLAKKAQERIDTLSITKESDYKEQKEPRDPKKGDTRSGDMKVLFVSYKQGGVDKKEIVILEKDNASGLWEKADGKAIERLKLENKQIAKEIVDFMSDVKK